MTKQVLVVDHDPLIRNLLSNLLTTSGFEPHQAVSKDEALALLQTNPYRLILLDLMLPDENGFRVLEHIRDHFPRQSQHLVVLTGADEKFISSVSLESCCAVLVKPFSITEFHRIVEHCHGGGHVAGSSYN